MKRLTALLLAVPLLLALGGCGCSPLLAHSRVNINIDAHRTTHALKIAVQASHASLASFTYPPPGVNTSEALHIPVDTDVSVTASFPDDAGTAKTVAFHAIEEEPFEYDAVVVAYDETIDIQCYEANRNYAPCPSPNN
jgi:hypothetical protein